MSHSRSVSVRDLVRWCSRANEDSDTRQTAAELLYQDAVDIFARFIPDQSIRLALAKEIAFTLNISKERALYFTETHKPSVSLKTAGLQVGRVLVPVTASDSAHSPPQSVFSITRHAASLLEAGNQLELAESIYFSIISYFKKKPGTRQLKYNVNTAMARF